MVVASNVRPGRTWRTLLGVQSAKGTPVSNFATGSNQIWSNIAKADFVRKQVKPEWWFNYHNGDYNRSRYKVQDLAKGTFMAPATPTKLLLALQSLFGSYSNPNFTLTGYVNAWLTLAYVEDKTLNNPNLTFMRFQDVLIHGIDLEVNGDGFIDLYCHYASEFQDSCLLSNLSSLGVTLPAAPMQVDDLNAMPGRTATFWRDPFGANVQVPFERINVGLNVNYDEYWDQLGRRSRAIRRGPLDTLIEVTGKPGDEYWQMMLDANSGTRRTYQLICTEPVTGHTLTMTFYNMTFNIPAYGINDKVYAPIVANGHALQDLSGNFVSISLT